MTTMDGETTGFSLSGHSFSLIQWLLSLEFNVGPIIKEMVEQAVKKSAKAPSPDNIPPECLKARVVVTANSMCIVARLVVYVCVCGGGGVVVAVVVVVVYCIRRYTANSMFSRPPKFTVSCCQLRASKSPQVHSVMFPTPCFQVAPNSQRYVSNSVLSSHPKFTVSGC